MPEPRSVEEWTAEVVTHFQRLGLPEEKPYCQFVRDAFCAHAAQKCAALQQRVEALGEALEKAAIYVEAARRIKPDEIVHKKMEAEIQAALRGAEAR